MVRFRIKELLEKNGMSRYRLRLFSGFTYERVNQFYFNTAKSIKVEELNVLCKIFECEIYSLIDYSKD